MKIFIITLMTLLGLGASEITVAAAANLSYAMGEMVKEFKRENPDIEVKVIFGGSGKLTAQIAKGAPYGIFLSADRSYPESLFKNGLTANEPTVYARGALAILSRKRREMDRGISILTDDSIRKIASANPKTAPYGKAAKEAMTKSGIFDKIAKKIVYAESISQTVAYTMTAADIGLVAKSSLYSPSMKAMKRGDNWVEVDPSLYRPIDQSMVILRYGKGKEGYEKFYNFILSAESRKILEKYGYILP